MLTCRFSDSDDPAPEGVQQMQEEIQGQFLEIPSNFLVDHLEEPLAADNAQLEAILFPESLQNELGLPEFPIMNGEIAKEMGMNTEVVCPIVVPGVPDLPTSNAAQLLYNHLRSIGNEKQVCEH